MSSRTSKDSQKPRCHALKIAGKRFIYIPQGWNGSRQSKARAAIMRYVHKVQRRLDRAALMEGLEEMEAERAEQSENNRLADWKEMDFYGLDPYGRCTCVQCRPELYPDDWADTWDEEDLEPGQAEEQQARWNDVLYGTESRENY